MKKFIGIIIAIFIIVATSVLSFAATGDLAYEPPFEFYSIAGLYDHGYALGVVRCQSTYLYGSDLCQVSYSQLVDFCSRLNSAQSYYQFVVTSVKSESSGNRYMVTARHYIESGNGFGSTYEGRLGGYASGNTVIYYAYVSSGSVPDSGSGSGSGSSGGSTSSPSDTDYTSLLEWIGNNISVLNDNLNSFWGDISNKLSTFDDWFRLQYNQVSDMFRVISANQLAEYDLLLTFLSSFDRRFSDLDLTYYNDAEITLYNGDSLDWSESDRGAMAIPDLKPCSTVYAAA